MPDLTHLDQQNLKSFQDNDLAAFRTELDRIQKDDPASAQALKSLADGLTTPDTFWYAGTAEHPPLAMGLLGADDTVHGQTLMKNLKSAISSVAGILTTQQTLFGDIDKNLTDTLTTLMKNQGDSLSSIDAAKMLDAFSDVDRDMTASQANTANQTVTAPGATAGLPSGTADTAAGTAGLPGQTTTTASPSTVTTADPSTTTTASPSTTTTANPSTTTTADPSSTTANASSDPATPA